MLPANPIQIIMNSESYYPIRKNPLISAVFKSCLVLLISGVFFGTPLDGQQYVISQQNDAEVFVTGGSSLHDWTVTTSEVLSFPEILNLSSEDGFSVQSFAFKVEVDQMDGGRGASMNKKIKDALKSREHPYVSFEQTGRGEMVMNDSGGFTMHVAGELSVAGVVRPVEVKVEGIMEDGRLVLEGVQPLLMSDFDITPPSAMFGQIKTKDDIEVHFRFEYVKQE